MNIINRHEILKRELAKEEIARKGKEEEEKNAEKQRQEKEIEEAFITEEQRVIQKEHADQMQTKRLVERLRHAPPEDVVHEIFTILSNFTGIYIFDF